PELTRLRARVGRAGAEVRIAAGRGPEARVDVLGRARSFALGREWADAAVATALGDLEAAGDVICVCPARVEAPSAVLAVARRERLRGGDAAVVTDVNVLGDDRLSAAL